MAQDTSFGLLLASADDGHPVLANGLPRAAVSVAPKPRGESRRAAAARWEAGDADPNDLRAQRWAVIAPAGSEGDRLLAAIAPLMRLRADEQGAEPRIYRVSAAMDAKASLRFREDVHCAEAVPEHERPRYLLILGDLHQVSIELQQVLAHGAFVGRIHFADASGETDLAGHAAYAQKVVRWAQRALEADGLFAEPDSLFHVVHDGTKPTRLAHEQLILPCLSAAEAWRTRGNYPAASVVEVMQENAGPVALLQAAAGTRPTVLLSVSHGLGAPRGGWPSAERQRAMQGALALGLGTTLTAETIRDARFLPGGMWFCVACFGAGTPPASAFYAWMSLLSKEGRFTGPEVEAVLKNLPQGTDRPFVAALPQAALANPEGPLAVIGHIDLAWIYGFISVTNPRESRASRILSALKVLVNGNRAGVALDSLMRSYREINDALMADYQAEEDALARGTAYALDQEQRGYLWMQRNDLRGYVLLGDPAARLSLRRGEAR